MGHLATLVDVKEFINFWSSRGKSQAPYFVISPFLDLFLKFTVFSRVNCPLLSGAEHKFLLRTSLVLTKFSVRPYIFRYNSSKEDTCYAVFNYLRDWDTILFWTQYFLLAMHTWKITNWPEDWGYPLLWHMEKLFALK